MLLEGDNSTSTSFPHFKLFHSVTDKRDACLTALSYNLNDRHLQVSRVQSRASQARQRTNSIFQIMHKNSSSVHNTKRIGGVQVCFMDIAVWECELDSDRLKVTFFLQDITNSFHFR